jgi:hypothetical protein
LEFATFFCHSSVSSLISANAEVNAYAKGFLAEFLLVSDPEAFTRLLKIGGGKMRRLI